MHQKTINLRGHDLHFEHLDGDDPPIVCLPGLTNSSKDFWGIVEHLGRNNVYAVDVWGQGRSPWIGEYSRDRDAADIAEFLHTVSGPAVLVGYSRGGLLSFRLADSHPELVRGVYAIDVTPYFGENPNVGSIPFLRAVFALEDTVREFRDGTRSFAWLTDAVGAVPVGADSTLRDLLDSDVLEHWSRDLSECDPDIWIGLRTPSATSSTPATATLAATQCPLHVAYGDIELGSVVAAGEADRMIAASRSATATHFPGHGHGIHQRSPQALAEDLGRFLADHDL